MYKIEKGLTMLERKSDAYPFQQMDVGDSFYVATSSRSTLQVYACREGQRLNRAYSVRKVDGGFRVWRIA
jgi:hypothetical protein